MATAAAESAKKLELLLECPICLKTLNQPKVFHCLHFFCAPCIGDLKPKTVDAEQCYECPTCRQITPVEKLRAMHFIHDLLEIMALAKKGQNTCDKCKDGVATHRCLDCKENFCEFCRTQHIGFSILQHHTWVELTDADQPIIDKHIYCQAHKGEVVKLHCKDCHKLICLLCNGTEHKLHQAETIDEAITYLLPLVGKRTDEVKNQISAKEKALNGVQTKVKDIRKTYDVIEGEIEAKCEAVIAKAREDCKKTKQELARRKHEHINKIEELEKKMENQLKGQRNIVALSETALASTQGTSLLQAMQSGILESLESHIAQEDIPTYEGNVNVKFQPAITGDDNTVGTITELKFQPAIAAKGNLMDTTAGAGVKPEHSKLINPKLSDVTKRTPTLQKTVVTGKNCGRLTTIGNELWYTAFDSTITQIYSLDGTKLRDITFRNIGDTRSVLQVSSGLAVASVQGLYLADMTGVIKHTLLTGHICDISLSGETLCALNNDDDKVHLLKLGQDGNAITKIKEIKIENYDKSFGLNTIQMTPQLIYVAVLNNNEIHKYTHDGTLVSEHGSQGTAVYQLKGPRICGADSEGTLLIADEGNHRLKTLTADGKWACLKVDGPRDAIIENDTLFVGQWNHQLKLYSLL